MVVSYIIVIAIIALGGIFANQQFLWKRSLDNEETSCLYVFTHFLGFIFSTFLNVTPLTFAVIGVVGLVVLKEICL